MGLLRNLQERRKDTGQKEVPWQNVRKERALRILAVRLWHLRFFSCPHSSQRGP